MNARSWNSFAPCVPAFLDFAFALRFRSYLNIFFCSRVPSFASRSCIAFLNRTLLAFLKFKPVKHAVPVVYGLHKTRSVNLLWENNLFPKRIIKYGKVLAKFFLFTRTATFLPSIPPLLTAFLYYDRLLWSNLLSSLQYLNSIFQVIFLFCCRKANMLTAVSLAKIWIPPNPVQLAIRVGWNIIFSELCAGA